MAAKRTNFRHIVQLVEGCARELLEKSPAVKSASSPERSYAIMLHMLSNEGSVPALKAAVQNDDGFGCLREGWIQLRGGVGRRLVSDALPTIFVHEILNRRAAISCISKACRLAKSQAARTEHYIPVAGITVSSPIRVSREIDIIPWRDVPPCDQKTTFDAEERLKRPADIPWFYASATSAIRIRLRKEQILFASHSEAARIINDTNGEEAKRASLIRDIVRCMTASNVGPVASLGRWSVFDNEIANWFIGSGYSWEGTIFEGAVSMASNKPHELDTKTFLNAIRKFETFRASEKDVIRIALDRLNQALRRHSAVDKAIDLGIVLEVMLLHGIDQNARTELRYRSSVRGALFLGGDRANRIATYRLLRNAYDIRSKAVHSGTLRQGKEIQATVTLLNDVAVAAAAIARKLITRGSFPDWDMEFVVGIKRAATTAQPHDGKPA